MTTPDTLPDDVAALRALVLTAWSERDAERAEKGRLIEERDQLADQNDRLRHLLRQLQRMQFGRRSEQLDPEQFTLALEDLEQAIAAGEAEQEKADPALRKGRSEKRRAGRGPLPEHLPRVEIVIEPEDTACPCCGGAMHVIGEDRSQRLDVVPAQYQVIVSRGRNTPLLHADFRSSIARGASSCLYRFGPPRCKSTAAEQASLIAPESRVHRMPLKVLQLLSRLEVGGTERAVIRLASRGTREGMDHSLLLFDKPFRSDALDFHPGILAAEFIQRRPGIDLPFALKLAKKFKGPRIDIVHAHNDTAIFYAALAMIMGRLTKVALIGTFHTWPSHDTTGARVLTRWASNRAAEITAVSQDLDERLLQSGWVHKCRTIWNGVDLAEFSPNGTTGGWRNKLGIPDDAVLVGHVGRFDPIKRHSDLFDSAAALQSTQPPIYFAVAGNGPLFDTFRKRAAQLPSVILLSNVKDVASFLRAIDIFVICSEHEGAPLALLEAMACARPIIATEVGGIPYILGSGPVPAGQLIPPQRVDLLTAAILQLAQDRELRIRLGQLAHQQIQRFSLDQEWSQYAGLYAAVSNT